MDENMVKNDEKRVRIDVNWLKMSKETPSENALQA
jgi:hypothetical protein